MGRVFAMPLIALAMAGTAFGALQKDPGPIPELKPPTGKIALDFPDSTIFAGALAFAGLVLVIGRIVESRKPKVRPPELPAAARALAGLDHVPEGDLAGATHVVRNYVLETFHAGDEGATAEEIAASYARHPCASEAKAWELREYLVGAEHARFGQEHGPEASEGCVARARALVEEIELAKVAATPPPLPPPPLAKA